MDQLKETSEELIVESTNLKNLQKIDRRIDKFKQRLQRMWMLISSIQKRLRLIDFAYDQFKQNAS